MLPTSVYHHALIGVRKATQHVTANPTKKAAMAKMAAPVRRHDMKNPQPGVVLPYNPDHKRSMPERAKAPLKVSRTRREVIAAAR